MRLNKKIIHTNLEYAISNQGDLKMIRRDHDMTDYFHQPGMIYLDHCIDLNDLDTDLLSKKIEQNTSFFRELSSMGIKSLLLYNHTIPTILLDLNFYIGAFLYSDLERVIRYLKHDKKHMRQTFVHPIFSRTAKEQAMKDLNWRRYFLEREERYMTGRKPHGSMFKP